MSREEQLRDPVFYEGYKYGMQLALQKCVHFDERELNKWREAGKHVGRKLGVVAERKRIIEMLDNEICLDYRVNGCSHEICAAYANLIDTLNRYLEVVVHKCVCGLESSPAEYTTGFEPPIYCPKCSKKMEKHIETDAK